MKKHSTALAFFAVSKQIPIVYSADRDRAEKTSVKDYVKYKRASVGCELYLT